MTSLKVVLILWFVSVRAENGEKGEMLVPSMFFFSHNFLKGTFSESKTWDWVALRSIKPYIFTPSKHTTPVTHPDILPSFPDSVQECMAGNHTYCRHDDWRVWLQRHISRRWWGPLLVNLCVYVCVCGCYVHHYHEFAGESVYTLNLYQAIRGVSKTLGKKTFKIIVGKGENVDTQYYLIFSLCFLPCQRA